MIPAPIRTGRTPDQLRPISITPHFLPHADGSVLIACGDTTVICTASMDESEPPLLCGTVCAAKPKAG